MYSIWFTKCPMVIYYVPNLFQIVANFIPYVLPKIPQNPPLVKYILTAKENITLCLFLGVAKVCSPFSLLFRRM
jgi:hypothetical protein